MICRFFHVLCLRWIFFFHLSLQNEFTVAPSTPLVMLPFSCLGFNPYQNFTNGTHVLRPAEWVAPSNSVIFRWGFNFSLETTVQKPGRPQGNRATHLHRWRSWTTPFPLSEVIFFHPPCSNDPEFKVWRPWLIPTPLTKPSTSQQKVCLRNVTFNLIFFVYCTERSWRVLFFFWLHILC